MRFSSIDHNRLLVDFKKKQFESALQKQEIPIGIMTDANVFLPTSIHLQTCAQITARHGS